MPQRYFDNIKGADVPYFELILLAELLPAGPKEVATIPLLGTTNQPRPGAVD
jgi:hypothetical protein